MSATEVDRHVSAAYDMWGWRSLRTWQLDLSILTDGGVTLAQPQRPEDRCTSADRALRSARQGEAAR
jgi:hypothetical protein